MYIDDCLRGTTEILAGDIVEPINLGSAELVTINQLVDIVEEIAGIKLERRYNLDAPQGRAWPQQRQHPVPPDLRVGAATSLPKGWRRPTRGSTTSSRRVASTAPFDR